MRLWLVVILTMTACMPSRVEMSTTGVWSERDPREATAEQGRQRKASSMPRFDLSSAGSSCDR
jgi:hypothetical protein